MKDIFLDLAFRSDSLADFATDVHFGREKADNTNAPTKRNFGLVKSGTPPYELSFGVAYKNNINQL